MQIPGPIDPRLPRIGSGPSPAAAPGPAGPVDRFVQADGPETLSMSIWRPDLDSAARIPEEPAPRLPRPVLFLHGYNGVPEEFSDMVGWLERDGANRSGGILDAAHPDPVDPDANLFTLRFVDPLQSVEKGGEQVRAAVEAICRATGASGVDVVAHSKGGLDARQYLMDADEKLDHVVTLGTPHHGTFMANLVLWLNDHFHYALAPPDKESEARATVHQFTVDRLHDGKPENPTLHRLNETWETQRGRAEFLAVDGTGVLSLGEKAWPTLRSDGIVPRSSAIPPNTPSVDLMFQKHGILARNPDAMRETAAFLSGQPSDARTGIEGPGSEEADGYLADRTPGSPAGA